MPIARFFALIVSTWLFVVATSFGVRALASRAPLTLPESLGWLFLGIAPVVILLSVFRGAPSGTVAKTLYDAEHSEDTALLKARITDVSRR